LNVKLQIIPYACWFTFFDNIIVNSHKPLKRKNGWHARQGLIIGTAISEDIFGLGYAQPMLSNCQKVNIKLVLG